MNSSAAKAEERIDSRADDATMERVDQHANAHRAPLSPAGPPLPHNSEPLSGQSDTPSLDVCVPCPPQTDRDRSRICFCDGLPQDEIIDTNLLRCQGKGGRCSIQFHKRCLQEFGWWGEEDNERPHVFCLECMTKDDPRQGTYQPDAPWEELEELHISNINHDALHEQLLRVGIKRTERAIAEDRKHLKSRVAKMEQILHTEDLQTFLNTKPRAYQTLVKMSDDAMSEHIRAGRDFDISSLLYEVEMCDCCGRVQPGHADPLFSGKDSPYTSPPFHRSAMMHGTVHVTIAMLIRVAIMGNFGQQGGRSLFGITKTCMKKNTQKTSSP